MAIVAGATLLSVVLAPSTVAAAHGVAFFAQVAISVRAGLSTGPYDPVSPKLALARNFLAKKRQMSRTLKDSEPLRDSHRREVEKLVAINAERQAYVAAHGLKMTEEYKALVAQFETQKAIVDPLTAETRALTERMQAETNEFRQAQQAWRNRNQRMAR